MKEQTIRTIIDYHLKRYVDMELNSIPIIIEKEMSSPSNENNEEWNTWLPIPSEVTNAEIEELEGRLGYTLPMDYKIFLKHKHFYQLHISEASFCPHPIHVWRAKLSEMIFEGYLREFLIDKGYIPFADWSDWGLLCFNTNMGSVDHNYPIVLWDHEMAYQVQEQYKDFYDLLIKLDEEERKNENG